MNDMAKDLETVSSRPVEADTLRNALQEDRDKYDCLSCRVMGAGAFIGLGAYTYFSGMNQLRQREAEILKNSRLMGMRSRRFGIQGLAATLGLLGFYRLIN